MLKQAKRSIFVCIDLLQSAWIEYQQDRAQYLAVAMIYYAIVSLVPLFSLLLSALGLLLRFSPVAADIEQKMMLHLEAHLGIQFLTVIRRLLEKLQRESIASFCISLVGLLLAASVLFSHLRPECSPPMDGLHVGSFNPIQLQS
jgi:membrane protein